MYSKYFMVTFRVEVYAMSNLSPASLMATPATFASFTPLSDRGTSTQPVNLHTMVKLRKLREIRIDGESQCSGNLNSHLFS